jgi:hypothetical protein
VSLFLAKRRSPGVGHLDAGRTTDFCDWLIRPLGAISCIRPPRLAGVRHDCARHGGLMDLAGLARRPMSSQLDRAPSGLRRRPRRRSSCRARASRPRVPFAQSRRRLSPRARASPTRAAVALGGSPVGRLLEQARVRVVVEAHVSFKPCQTTARPSRPGDESSSSRHSEKVKQPPCLLHAK